MAGGAPDTHLEFGAISAGEDQRERAKARGRMHRAPRRASSRRIDAIARNATQSLDLDDEVLKIVRTDSRRA